MNMEAFPDKGKRCLFWRRLSVWFEVKAFYYHMLPTESFHLISLSHFRSRWHLEACAFIIYLYKPVIFYAGLG